MAQQTLEPATDEWVAFPGGELEGKRPKALCPACREALKRAANGARGAFGARQELVLPGRQLSEANWRRARMSGPRLLCFQCYRADLDRNRALRAAGDLDTASEERFHFQLPLEPVDRPRLERLKAERADARAATPQYESGRRRAQIEARRALRQIAAGLRARDLAAPGNAVGERAIFQAVHAAELQLPESWLPFVVSR